MMATVNHMMATTSRKLPGVRDTAANVLVRSYQLDILEYSVPSTIGDGNCLFPDLSRGVFDDEDSLLTAIEIIEYRHLYDTPDSQYCDSVQYVRLLHDSYDELLMSVLKPGGFSELMVLFVASAS